MKPVTSAVAGPTEGGGNFFDRWGARPVVADTATDVAAADPTASTAAADAAADIEANEPPATLADAQAVPIGGDVSRFMRPGTDPQVQRTALKRLLADPHYNVMDGLDIYIDDYGKPDPVPAAWLPHLAQSVAWGMGRVMEDAPADGTASPVPPNAALAASAPAPASMSLESPAEPGTVTDMRGPVEAAATSLPDAGAASPDADLPPAAERLP